MKLLYLKVITQFLVPDTDRMWYTFGATYRFTPNLSVDAGYAFVKGKNLSFDEFDQENQVSRFI